MAIARRFRDRGVRLDLVALESREVPAVADFGFEAPALAAGEFRYAPAGAPWTFGGSSGVSADGSAFTAGNFTAPEGRQVAFVQGTGTVTQTTGFTAGTYAITFNAAQRGNVPGKQTLQVFVDGQLVGTFDNITGPGYSRQVTTTFTLAEGTHTIAFKGTNLFGGDNTVFIDQVAVIQQAAGLNDAGFELPGLKPGQFVYAPTGGAWSFSSSAGVAANGSAFTEGNAWAPTGSQVAFVQGLGVVSQSMNLVGGTYTLSFAAAQRGNLPSAQTIQVYVNDLLVGSFNGVTGAGYTTQQSSSFTVATGLHTLTFKGTNLAGGDNTVFIDQVAFQPQAARMNDSGFELPGLNRGAFKYNPASTAWTFTGTAGVAADGSGFTSGNPVAPQGGQVAFLQRTGSVSQVAAFAPGNYVLSFAAAQRGNFGGTQSFQVLVDGIVVGNFTGVAGAGYTPQVTTSFAVASGNHTITFQGTTDADNTVFIDNVTVIPQAAGITDTGFEVPVLPVKAFKYDAAGSGWDFDGTAGVSANNSPFTAGNPVAPQGGQVLLVQNTGSARQSVRFAAGTYAIGFVAAQRGNAASAQTFQVLVDGVIVGSFNNVGGPGYTPQTTSTFTVSEGHRTVTFLGTNLYGGDNTVLIDDVVVLPQAAGLTDSGGEQPVLTPGGFRYKPDGAPWKFQGPAGVAANGSAFTAGNPLAPQGSQVLFLQQQGTVSQTAVFQAGTYALQFAAAQRGNLPSVQSFDVLVDDMVVGRFNSLTGTSYVPLATTAFTLAAGPHTVTFRGTNLNGGDNTVLIDQVTVVPV